MYRLIIVHVYKYDVNLAQIMFFRKCCCCLSEDVVPIKEGGNVKYSILFCPPNKNNNLRLRLESINTRGKKYKEKVINID